MNQPLLLVERIEFEVVKIGANRGSRVEPHEAFPQLKCDFEKIELLVRSELDYPESEARDPSHFRFLYGMKIDRPSTKESAEPPYLVEVEAVGFFRYVGGETHTGVERFRAVRFTGYQILYGAIREMVANVTARGPNGLWHLPGRNFHGVAKAMSEKDEEARLEKMKQLAPESSSNPLSIEQGASSPMKRKSAVVKRKLASTDK
jgi:preprotein translocase subunit SecB